MHIRPFLNNSMQPSTHGTSAQRVKWFNPGFQSGEVKVCDTFVAAL